MKCLFYGVAYSAIYQGSSKVIILWENGVVNGVPDEWQDSRIVGQRELQSPVVGGRDIRLDILAKDSTGKQYNVEVQQKPEGHISDGPDSIAA